MKRLFIACCFAATPLLMSAQKTAAPLPITVGTDIAVVPTEQGKVRGYIHNGTYIYKGIPYAQAKRFQLPTKPAAWEGVRSSLTYGPVCPLVTPVTQVNDESEFPFHHDWGYPNEDCLRLNIWTQGVNDGKKRPVMFWIHGGGYTAGSSQELPSYDGENISKKGDVVLVSVNHRLNILGFLDLSEFGDKYKASANVGMIDLVAALEWVKANISNFGGDPNNVTIFGQSGGGGKVTTLMNAPSAKGLFHKAIVQSGVWSDFQDPAITKRIGAALLTELGLIPSKVDSIQKIPYDKLAAAGTRALQKVREQLAAEGKPVTGFRFGWSPVLDGNFLPFQPTEAKALALSDNVPLLIGSTKNEFMASLRNPALRKGTAEEVRAHLEKIYGDKTDAYIAAVKTAYPGDTRPNDLADIDGMFRPGMVTQANIKSATASAPVYMYLFTWQSPIFDGVFKAVHCMEIPFVFNNIARCEEMTGGGKDAHALANKMSQSWINFARTGNPVHKGLPAWPNYTAASGATMFFDLQCVVKNHHDREVLEFFANGPRL
jgi:para-nitrobenzyl esterase